MNFDLKSVNMVAPETMALVVRQRGGPNLIVHTRGIPGTLVHRACEEAVTIMGRFALGRGQTDVDGSGDIHPKFAHDRLLVLNGRYAVVYRLVYKVWVMAVTTEHSNSLIPVRLVETATKGLVATCQVLEVDHEVISRNYQEVYFMMGAILKYQGADLQKSQAEALANIYSYIADTREKKSRSSTDVTKRVSTVREGRPRLTDSAGSDSSYCFEMPDDFKQVPNPLAADLSTSFGLSAAVDPFSALTGSPGVTKMVVPLIAPKPVVHPVPTDLTDLDELLGNTPPAPVVVQARSLGAAQPVLAPPPADTSVSWFDFGTEQKTEIAAPMAQPPSPPRTGPLLYHMEKWEGTFEGSRCTKSFAFGEVGLRKHIWKSVAGKELQFRLIADPNQAEQSKYRPFSPTSPDWVPRGVKYLIKSAQRNTARTSLAKEGILLAKMKPAPQPYLKYRLLPGLYDIPVRLEVSAALGEFKGDDKCLILLVQLTANAKNKSAANGSLFVWLPRQLGSPIFTRPRPEFSQKQSLLKWTVQRFQPEQKILFKAVLSASDCVEEAVVKSIRVEMNCIGAPRTTFSGVVLAQESVPSRGYVSETAAASVWTASVSARP